MWRIRKSTLVLDIAKGTAAVLAARAFGPDMAAVAMVAVVLGHVFPPWLGFNGGKGVATSAGALLAYQWPVGLAVGATWLAVALVTRYYSLAAIVATVLAPLYAWLLTRATEPTVTVALIALLVLERHRANIIRLARGEESRISLGKRGS